MFVFVVVQVCVYVYIGKVPELRKCSSCMTYWGVNSKRRIVYTTNYFCFVVVYCVSLLAYIGKVPIQWGGVLT